MAATWALWFSAQVFKPSRIPSKSRPSIKPETKFAPIAAPSSMAPVGSMPSSARNPAVMPLPRPRPRPAALSAKNWRPLPFHHSSNGSATILSQAMPSLPQMSALAHSSLAVNSAMVWRRSSTFASTWSITSPIVSSTSGILLVIHVANSRRYGERRSPRAIFAPSTADCSSVKLPFMLSSIVSAICWDAPSALFTAAVSLL